MNTRHRVAAAALALSGLCLSTAAVPAQASAASASAATGTTSLAEVLAADGHHFDHNPRNFDILDHFVMRILHVKPNSRLAILTHGDRRVTAFLPTDGAFRRAATEIVGKRFHSERRVFRSLWRAGGLQGAENVLLYHLVAGRTLTSQRLSAQAPTRLRTMQGHHLRVRVRAGQLVLLDRDRVSPDARVIPSLADINKGNRQIAHGISQLLSPVVE